MSAAQLKRLPERKRSELLFAFDCGSDRYRCELREQGELGLEVLLIKNGESIRSRAFVARAEATSWAITQRDGIVRNWGIW